MDDEVGAMRKQWTAAAAAPFTAGSGGPVRAAVPLVSATASSSPAPGSPASTPRSTGAVTAPPPSMPPLLLLHNGADVAILHIPRLGSVPGRQRHPGAGRHGAWTS